MTLQISNRTVLILLIECLRLHAFVVPIIMAELTVLVAGLFPVKLLKYHNFNLQGENVWTQRSKSLTQPIC